MKSARFMMNSWRLIFLCGLSLAILACDDSTPNEGSTFIIASDSAVEADTGGAGGAGGEGGSGAVGGTGGEGGSGAVGGTGGVGGMMPMDECATNHGGCGDPQFTTCADTPDAPPVCTDIDECANDNGGCGDVAFITCTNNEGAAPTCTDIDECATDNGGCGDANVYTCTNNEGAAPTCTDIDECATNNGGCGDVAFITCTNNEGAAPTCTDIDECANDNGGCGDAAFFSCTNNEAAAPTCADIDECANENGSCGDAVFITCTNNAGAAPTCTDIDECANENGGCGDAAFVSCTNNEGAAPTCTDIDECVNDNGDCGDAAFFSCTNNQAAAPTCADIDECANENGGCGDAVFITCTNNEGAAPTCTDIDECANENGGCGDAAFVSCTNNQAAAPTCADIDECANGNGGCGDAVFITCTNNEGAPPTCIDIDECAQNNGGCGNAAFFSCTNEEGAPPTCEDIDECAQNNGGCGLAEFITCTNNEGATPTCTDIDECAENNGGCLDDQTCRNQDGAAPICSFCGDGVIDDDRFELCDDANGIAGDGCESNCTLTPSCVDDVQNGNESDIDCGGDCEPCLEGQMCVMAQDCGSGLCDDGLCAASACDDGRRNGEETDIDCGGDCDPCQPGFACRGSRDCDSGVCFRAECAAPWCGDGVNNQPEEECDDGNNDNGDSCLDSCVRGRCGDGIVRRLDEECDDGNLIDTDGCTNACESARCGDGHVWAGVEACDDPEQEDAFCPYGEPECSVCTDECTSVPGVVSFCGDGVVDAAHESCEDGNEAHWDRCAHCQVATTRICDPFSNVGDLRERTCDRSGTVTMPSLELMTVTTPDAVALGDDAGIDGHQCGQAIDIEGEVAVFGCPGVDDDRGKVFIYGQGWNGEWAQVQALQDSTGETGDNFGWSVSQSGERLLVGALGDDEGQRNAGSALIFERQPDGQWREAQKLVSANPQRSQQCGVQVLLVGEEAFVACGNPSSFSERNERPDYGGPVLVFRRGDDGVWVESQSILPPDPESPLGFGFTMSESNGRLAFGRPRDREAGEESGAVFIYERDEDGVWQQRHKILAADGGLFGKSVALAGDALFIGAPDVRNEQGNELRGAVYVFERQEDDTWLQRQTLVSEPRGLREGRRNQGLVEYPASSMWFGKELAVSGDRLFITDEVWSVGLALHVFARFDDGLWRQSDAFIGDDSAGLLIAASGDNVLFGNKTLDRPLNGTGQVGFYRASTRGVCYEHSFECDVRGQSCTSTKQCLCLEGAAGPECDQRPLCGDGVIQAAEECDDENDVDLDLCRTGCRRNVAPLLYDILLDRGEVAVGEEITCSASGWDSDEDELAYHYVWMAEDQVLGEGAVYQVAAAPESEIRCIATVTDHIETSEPLVSRAVVIHSCGDGFVEDGVEACDDGNLMEGDGCDTNCTVTACGNGVVTAGEVCDDGNDINGDGCDQNCTVTACGNGAVSAPEECDDGNDVDDDGCDTNCTVTACGNGIRTQAEDCDDGNDVEGDGCDSNCTVTACGNEIISDGESCDDGNAVEGDGCDTNCTVTGCGNGIRTQGEVCEDGNLIDGDGCDSNCTRTGCNNGVQTEGEDCDDGNLVDGDGCDTNCSETGCGNGVTTEGEDCDDGNLSQRDDCLRDCTAARCGDGHIRRDSEEECDDGNVDTEVCAYGELACIVCASDCTRQPGVTAYCGDGQLDEEGGEECDEGSVSDDGACLSNCTVARCGDGAVHVGVEACDDGNENPLDGCTVDCIQWSDQQCQGECDAVGSVQLLNVVGDDAEFASGGFGVNQGFAIDIHENFIVVGMGTSADGRIRTLMRSPDGAWMPRPILSSNSDEFGSALALSEEYLLVGAPGKAVGQKRNAGGLTVYRDNPENENWTSAGFISSPAQNSVRLGSSVAIVGDTLVAGAPGGRGFVAFHEPNDVGGWSRGQVLDGRDFGTHEFGASLTVSGDTLFVGTGNGSSSPPEVMVFERDEAGLWTRLQTFGRGDRDEGFGATLAAHGDVLVVGTRVMPWEAGRAYIFERNGDRQWQETHQILAPEGVNGFGYYVSLDGDQMLIGAPFRNLPDAEEIGAVFLYQREPDDRWLLSQEIRAGNGQAGDEFSVVALEDGTAVVGSRRSRRDNNSGAAYRYTISSGTACTPDGACVCRDGWQGAECSEELP